MEQKPSVGRIVHYVSYGTPKGEYQSVCRAAIIAGIKDADETCDIVVFNPGGLFFNACKHDEPLGVDSDGVFHESEPGTWHWPERV